MSFYVYQYIDEVGLPYYIGKGSGNRIRANHLYTQVPPRDQRVIVKSELTEQQACELENQLIRQYGRKVDGGLLDNIKLNQWACTTGWKHSDKTKQTISAKNKGKIRSETAKQKYRQPKTAEHAEKIRQANIGRKDDGRYVKIAMTKSKQRWYTNGETTIMVEPGAQPIGFFPGRKLNG